LWKRLWKALTDIGHIVGGVFVGIITCINPLGGYILTLSYILYQISDYLEERDVGELKEDILEFTIGLFGRGLHIYYVY